MPLYEYECKQCHQRVEKIQSFSAPPEKICPQCGGELERVISAPALQFKGAGWYVNDYAKSGSKAAAAKNGGDGKAENKSESASESKSVGSKSAGASETNSSTDSATAKAGSGSSSSDTSSSAGSGSANSSVAKTNS